MALNYRSKLFGGGPGGGGSGTPGGADTQVQFNNAGVFGGDAGLTYDAATDTLTVTGAVASDVTSIYGVVAGRTYDGIGLGSGGTVKWSATTPASAKDLGLARSAAGVLKVTDGGAGYGSLSLFGSQFLSSPAAATLQLGAAASATPVAQTLQAQGGSGTDIAGATPFKIAASKGTGAGTPGSIVLQTSVRGTTGTTVQTASDRFYVSGNEKTLTLGSNTNFVRVDFPASSTISVGIEYNVSVYDTAAPPEFKAHGGRYGISAYRKSTGNAVAGTVVETLESAVQSVGNAMTDVFTVTGDANGILIGTNVTVGSGLTGSPVGTLRYTVSVNGSGAATVTPQ